MRLTNLRGLYKRVRESRSTTMPPRPAIDRVMLPYAWYAGLPCDASTFRRGGATAAGGPPFSERKEQQGHHKRELSRARLGGATAADGPPFSERKEQRGHQSLSQVLRKKSEFPAPAGYSIAVRFFVPLECYPDHPFRLDVHA